MAETPPETTPEHEASRFAEWAQKHLAPDLETVRRDAGNASEAAKQVGIVMKEVAAVAAELAKGAGAEAPLALRAAAAAEEAAKVAALLAAL